MGQLLHEGARTTAAVRRAIQRRQASLAKLAARDDVHPKTVAKWRKRSGVREAPMGAESPCSTVLSREEAVVMVTCRKPTLLPLDDSVSARNSRLQFLGTEEMGCRDVILHSVKGLICSRREKVFNLSCYRYPCGIEGEHAL
jgi:hypothetical protein